MKFKSENELKTHIKEFEKDYTKGLISKDIILLDSTCKNLYLSLRIGKKGITKTFLFRYSFKSKIQVVTLGKYPLYNLNEARSKAKELNTILISLEYKNSNVSLKEFLHYSFNKTISFNSLCDKWLNSKNVRQVSLNDYKYRISKLKKSCLAKDDITKITKQDIITFLKEYETENKLSMLKLYYRILKSMFEYALNYDYLETSPFNKIKYNILFKQNKTKHHKTLNENELKNLLYELRNKKDDYYLAIRFLIYVPLRVKNIVNLTWEQVNFKERMLYIKGSDMKNHKDFKLPLSSQALEILYYLYNRNNKVNEYVFNGKYSNTKEIKGINLNNAFIEYMEYIVKNPNCNRKEKGIKNKELKKKYNINIDTLRRYKTRYKESYLKGVVFNKKSINDLKLDIGIFKHYCRKLGFNPHSIRGTFSTILYEKTPLHNKDLTIIEMCLSHDIGNQIIASYNHSERLQERRELMQFWSDYIDSLKDFESKNIEKVSNDSFILNYDDDRLRF